MRKLDFAKQVKSAIEEVLSKPEKINHDVHDKIRRYSQSVVDRLIHLNNQFLNSEAELNDQDLQSYVSLLKKNWENSKNKDYIFSYNPHTHGNKICIRLAEMLSSLVHEHPYKLLMPTLVMGDYSYDEPLDSVVMSDNNDTYINVVKCLENAHANKDSQLKHTHPLKNQPLELSPTEQQRVINFSYQTRRYYKEIVDQSQAGLDKARNNLRKRVGYSTILGTYGNSSEQLATFYRDREHLIQSLNTLKPRQWERVLKHIPAARLQKMILDELTLEKAMVNKKFYTGNPAHDKTLLYLFLKIYIKTLEDRTHNFKSYLGWALAYSKTQKLPAANSLKKIFLSDTPLSDIPQAIQSLSDVKDKRIYADGSLGILVNQIKLVNQPEFIAEQKPRRWFGR